jgi:hypothetical protein
MNSRLDRIEERLTRIEDMLKLVSGKIDLIQFYADMNSDKIVQAQD